MPLKIRISTMDGKHVSASSSIEDLLTVLREAEQGLILLNPDEEDSLRGWLLLRADALNKGELVCLDEQKTFCAGKSAEGRPFVRDPNGDWPPVKPEF